ncbi:PREDICTED: uncharacterized protein LOC104799319 [Tarenaya hassleriana]|uniref:uncharacterized protein LOC104799319 n=1 Tax=Tarenaya hassleriana TaxID=28532 RepID=UPI00053C46EC|nr:PREDICTED: uncharacterized protein LOC104799319 [Tarenaya hassleriana]XP_010520072.1 PREDICTED: uncharacterized protein LOC104799319 [Tarenaya hassleriana]
MLPLNGLLSYGPYCISVSLRTPPISLNLEHYFTSVDKADNLRLQTLQQMLRILTISSCSRLFSRLHALSSLWLALLLCYSSLLIQNHMMTLVGLEDCRNLDMIEEDALQLVEHLILTFHGLKICVGCDLSQNPSCIG